MRLFGILVTVAAALCGLAVIVMVWVDVVGLVWMFVAACSTHFIWKGVGNTVRNSLVASPTNPNDPERLPSFVLDKYFVAFAAETLLTFVAAVAVTARVPLVSWVAYDSAALFPLACYVYDVLYHFRASWWWFRNRACLCCVRVDAEARRKENEDPADENDSEISVNRRAQRPSG